MTYRKTRLSYVIWSLYTCLCVMLLAFVGYSVYGAYVKAAPAKLGALLIFPLLVCIYLTLKKSSLALRKRLSVSSHSKQMIEALCVSVAFVFGFLVRLRMFRYADAILSSSETLGGSFLEKAFVQAGGSIEPIAHGVSHLYVLTLSAVFSFWGNSVGAAMFLQIVLQLVSMLLAYRLVKAAAGQFSACSTLLLLAFSPVYVEKVAAITPECLFFLLYLFGLSVVVFYGRAVLTDQPVFKNIFTAVLPGLMIGILTFWELSIVTTLLFLVVLFIGKRGETQTGEIGKNILRLLLAIVSCAAGFFILIAVDAVTSGVSLERSLYVWAYPYLQTFGVLSRLGELYGNVLFCGVLIVPASFLVFEFSRSGKEQDHSPWLFFCMLSTPFLLWEVWTIELSNLALFFWSIAAALGVKNCVFGKEAEVMQAKIEQINAAAVSIPVVEEPANGLTQKPQFLENPLPLPKRHVKKEMDYDYPVAPEMMHFDLETADGDDFPL